MIDEQGIMKAATTVSEMLGHFTSPLAAGAAGAGLGALAGGGLGLLQGKGNAVGGALAGAGVGGGVGLAAGQLGNILGGPLAALLTKTKTDEEMEEAGESSAADYLIPGHGLYGLLKRLGHSQSKYD